MSEQPSGPSKETLRNLRGMLPSFVKGMKEKVVTGRGKETIPIVRRPHKCCKVCAGTFDFKMVKVSDDTKLTPSICASCQGHLDAKEIAFVCGDKYAFVLPTNNRFYDMEGQIVSISPHVMAEIGKKFDVLKQKEQDKNDDTTGET